MHKKISSLLLSLTLLGSSVMYGVPANAVTVDSEPTGQRTVESADDFSWDNANVYFLLTDRFYNGNTSNDHSYGRTLDTNGNVISGWNTAPGTFHGGDFAGITKKINEGYFDSIGTNAIWISAPYEQIHGYIGSGDSTGNFAHYSYHGYYVLDYTETDANFGTKEEFKTMVDTAHAHGIRVVMDIVMNHVGYNNFVDMMEYNYGTITNASAINSYRSKLTNVQGYHDYIDYNSSAWTSWWGPDWIRCGLPGYTDGGGDDITMCLSGLPDLKTESTKQTSIPQFLQTKWQKEGTLNAKLAKYGNNNTVSDYLTTWLAEWVETYGVDGFRCDTAKHVELASWKKLKTKCVAALNTWRKNNPTAVGADWDEDFWMTGECWGYGLGKSSYHTEGGFDSMINFSYGGGVPDIGSINGVYQNYASSINNDESFNVLTYISSHDTTLARSNPYYQGSAFQLMPGGIQVYYGDESNRPVVSGLNEDGSGHTLRSDMNWSGTDTALLAHWQKVGQFRNKHVAVGAGSHQQISAYSSSTGYTFSRSYDDGITSDGIIATIGAPKNTNITVDVSSMWSNGTVVTNYYTGATATVQNGKATFNSGAQGTILIEGPQSTISMSLKGDYSFYDKETVTVSLRGADYAMVSINGGSPFKVVDGQTFEIGDGIAVGTVFNVEMTATNSEETLTKTFTFKKKDPNAVTRIYFDNSQYKWSTINAYVYDESVSPTIENAAWPGVAMSYDSKTGLYVYEVPDNLVNGAVIFNAGQGSSNRYPGEMEKGLEIKETDMLFSYGNKWTPYNGEKADSTTPTETPDPDKNYTVYYDNSNTKWSVPYVYYWVTDPGPIAWPGVAMTKVTDTVWKATFPKQYDKCIFSSNGSNKTDDLDIPGDGYIFKGSSWEKYADHTQPTTAAPTTAAPTTVQPSTSPKPAEKLLIGDADLNGKINIKDVTEVQRHLAEFTSLTGKSAVAADVDFDKTVSIKDATYIQKYVAEYSSGTAHCGEYTDYSEEQPTQPTQPTQPATQPTQPATQPTTQPSGDTVTLSAAAVTLGNEVWYAWTWNTKDDGVWVYGGKGETVTFTGLKTNVIFARINPDKGEPNWDDKESVWNQTDDLVTQAGGTYTITDWGSGKMVGSWAGSEEKPTQPSTPPSTQPPTQPSDGDTVTLSAAAVTTGDEIWYAWTWNTKDDGVWVRGGTGSTVIFTGLKTNVVFARVNPAKGEPNWNTDQSVWNQTEDLVTKKGGTYTITDWGSGKMVGSWN